MGKTLLLEKHKNSRFDINSYQFFKKLKKIRKKSLDFDSGLKLILDVPGNKISHTSMIRIMGKVIQTAYWRIINGLKFWLVSFRATIIIWSITIFGRINATLWKMQQNLLLWFNYPKIYKRIRFLICYLTVLFSKNVFEGYVSKV